MTSCVVLWSVRGDRGIRAVTQLTARSALAVVPCTRGCGPCPVRVSEWPARPLSGDRANDARGHTCRDRRAGAGARVWTNSRSSDGVTISVPRSRRSAYLEIPWRESFYIAINEARETDRPILLWAMNGHPLGCT